MDLRHFLVLFFVFDLGSASPSPFYEATLQLTMSERGLLRKHSDEQMQLVQLHKFGKADQPEPPFREDGELQFKSKTGDVIETLKMEVPTTFSHFMRGLMFRHRMNDDESMIFRWNAENFRGFWMENTYIPLDIVYVNRKKEIVSIKKAQPLDLHSVESDGLAMAAIEVKQGWCKDHGVKVGDSVDWTITAGHESFVASDALNFGATAEEVQIARAEGNFN
eukprot:TRINITY_DN35144_c0_g1_i1.p1 TRINITY_DN35144_c0_g1~~TRINITY_DN35144_c0_g1_i1.p1  ORF type:complete len:221 (-),score=50.54 TRINITY_DN35144_c0_g1_i1:70-732(-)